MRRSSSKDCVFKEGQSGDGGVEAVGRKWFEVGVCGNEKGEPWMFAVSFDEGVHHQRCDTHYLMGWCDRLRGHKGKDRLHLLVGLGNTTGFLP